MFAGILLLVTSGVASAIRYEAEDGELIGWAEIYPSDPNSPDPALSNGFGVCCLRWEGWFPSSGVKFTNMPATNGFSLRYSTGGAPSYRISLYINDIHIKDLVPVNTGDWNVYSTMEVTGITVNAGDSISIIRNWEEYDEIGINIDYIEYYNWTGFFEPIDNLAVNLVKGGSAIPVKFSLDGNQGLNIFQPGYPKSVVSTCPGDAPVDVISPDETDTSGQSGLSYDPLADQYVYVWKTNKAWTGCRQLQVMLNDGQTYSALFQFRN